MSINIGQVNEPDVIKLADLIARKKRLVDEMRHEIKLLNSGDAVLKIGVNPPKDSGRVFYKRCSQELQDAINSQSEWIIDRIYDTAIQSLENEISLLADKVMQNLISANSRTITF